MSADSYSVCPKCSLAAAKSKLDAVAAAELAYETKPAREWERLRRIADSIPEPDQTVREDYEIGLLTSGQFIVTYEGSCSACDFHFKFDHKEFPLPPTGTP